MDLLSGFISRIQYEKEIKLLRAEYNKLQKKMEEEKNTNSKEMESLKTQNENLKKQMKDEQKKNSKEFEIKVYEILSPIFTRGQIHKLLHPKQKKIMWSSEDIANTIAIRNVSPKCYRYLRKKIIHYQD